MFICKQSSDLITSASSAMNDCQLKNKGFYNYYTHWSFAQFVVLQAEFKMSKSDFFVSVNTKHQVKSNICYLPFV